MRPDGSPSPALRRRIGYGAAAAVAAPDAPVFCSGAPGAHGPSEASVIAAGLSELGVDAGRLVLDETSRDTLQSVVAACGFMRRGGFSMAVICTDAYHTPRTRMLFSVLGTASRPGPIDAGPAGDPKALRRMQMREWAAYPYDLGVALARRRALRRLIGAAG